MNDQVTALTPAVQPVVELNKPASPTGTMAEYIAAKNEAKESGTSIESVLKEKAAVIAKDEPAAAVKTEATDEIEVDDKKTTEPATEDDPIAKIEETHAAKKGVEKRFGELTAQREAAKAEAEAAKSEAVRLKAEMEQLRAQSEEVRRQAEAIVIPVVPSAEDDPVPNRDLFDDPDNYSAAIAGHAAREAIREGNKSALAVQQERQEASRQAQQQAQQAQFEAFDAGVNSKLQENITKAKSVYPDFEAKVLNNPDAQIEPAIFYIAKQSELGADILYHFATNPEIADSFNKEVREAIAMNIPVNYLVEKIINPQLAKMESAIKEARKPRVSKAAEPVKPVGQRASPEAKTMPEMSMEEYDAHRQAANRAKWEKEHRRPLRK